jgi:hypothetical protein
MGDKMSIKARILAFMVALLTTVGIGVGVATPAQAWGYCNPHTIIDNRVMLYDHQGYCGNYVATQWSGSPGQCITLYSGTGNNWAGSVDNTLNVVIVLHNMPGCASGPYKVMQPNTADPDLYNDVGMGNAVSSIRVGG